MDIDAIISNDYGSHNRAQVYFRDSPIFTEEQVQHFATKKIDTFRRDIVGMIGGAAEQVREHLVCGFEFNRYSRYVLLIRALFTD
ncbi:hypothetical protein BMJ31_15210 [Sinorhizobium medicae]|nr:hypothetical protein BMJ31_15210 [Sinorhizobium medicae]